MNAACLLQQADPGSQPDDKLEPMVLPSYYGYQDAADRWVKVMKVAISKNASFFNSHRMMRRYATEAYIR